MILQHPLGPDPWDTASDLNRPGVFRLNIAVGRTAFEKLTGYPPGEHDARSVRLDYTALDRLIPHLAYAAQAWVRPGAARECHDCGTVHQRTRRTAVRVVSAPIRGV